jgi:ABC-2 type transport system permease protein
MVTVLQLLRKDLAGFLRDRVALVLTFIVPLGLIYIMGQVFGVTGNSSGPTGIPIALVDASGDPAVEKIAAAIEAEPAFRLRRTWTDDAGAVHPIDEARAREDIRLNRYRFALVFPADALADDRFGLRVRLLLNPRNEIETQTVLGLLQKTIYTSAPQFLFSSLRKRAEAHVGVETTGRFYDQMAGIVANTFGGDREEIRRSMNADGDPLAAFGMGPTSGDTTSEAGNLLGQIVDFEQEQLTGQTVANPMATRSVGGWAIMFLMFAVTGAASSLFEEKRAGLFLRLLSMPVTRAHILWSKYLFNLLLGLVQLLTLFAAGWLLFKVQIWAHLPNLIIVCLAASAACTAFGMLIAAVSRSVAVASGLGTFLILSMSAVGGAWFPVSFMPEFMQSIAKFTLVYWAQEGFVQTLWAGAPLRDLLPILGVLVAMAAVLNTVSVVLFRRGDMFE